MLSGSTTRRAPRAITELLESVIHDDPAAAPPAVAVRNSVSIPLRSGARATFISFTGLDPGAEHFAIRFDEVVSTGPQLVRVHSECITGDLFGSQRCDCGAQLQQAMDLLQARGGILLYLRQEGRGIGLAAKLNAYVLQDGGLDTYAANRALALPDDARDYACGAAMLKALGVQAIRLISNNPDKATQLTRHGIAIVERVATGTFLTPHNQPYLAAKARISGHSLRLE